MLTYVVLILSVVSAIVGFIGGDYYSKLWATSHDWSMALRACAIYTFSSLGWLGLVRFGRDVFVPSIAWSIGGAVCSAIIGIWVFSEKPTTMQWLGVIIAIPAMLLMIVGGRE